MLINYLLLLLLLLLRRQGNLKEATDLLQKAESVVERELDKKDHKWKVIMKIQKGLLCDEKHQKGEQRGSRGRVKRKL